MSHDDTSGDATPFGAALRRWRKGKGLSQMDLAMAAGISTRHLSFLETGRANPSRGMVLRLAETLAVPLRYQNDLMASAGFAARYRETALSADEFAMVRDMLERLLAKHEPWPALVVDHRFDIVMTNQAAALLIGWLGLAVGEDGRPANVLRLLFAPRGLRQRVENWETAARAMLVRAQRDLAELGAGNAHEALREILGDDLPPADWLEAVPDKPILPLLPLTFVRGEARHSWFTTITTFGTPQDVTMQELRIESFFPADKATDSFATEILGGTAGRV
ncbi:helix-turn-helix domain-containing protein [Oceanibacterium hippocampi]|uniref:Anaerobic benzoate catabolism transcriptional regulator n=1 Tax=Oceanibacterium hippocampi TaxID=745714 RepID=A0A1Y5RTW4_9PROT|nr:helix-turn-helix transcriptional regulator [Oceanibacterium hippocampi]SLN25144.1 anaerobic benzoate catabolism transcriptional regulator [Oceanibacterium hippocampi]